MVMSRMVWGIHAHWWRHEAVKIGIKWWITVRRMLKWQMMIMRSIVMEGTRSVVPEAAVALFLGCFHHTLRLLIGSFLIVLFLLSG